MKNFMLAVLLFFGFITQTYACTLTHTAGLSPAVIKQLEAECEKAKQAAIQTSSEVDIEKISKYTDVGIQVATAVAATAKELGIAVNEFIKSPAGVIITFIIVVSVLGKAIFGFIYMVLGLFLCVKFLNVFWNKQSGTYEVTSLITKRITNKPIYTRISFDNASDSLKVMTFITIAIYGMSCVVLISKL